MKAYRGSRDVSLPIHVSASLLPWKNVGIFWIEGWVGPTARLVVLEKRGLSYRHWDLNPDSPDLSRVGLGYPIGAANVIVFVRECWLGYPIGAANVMVLARQCWLGYPIGAANAPDDGRMYGRRCTVKQSSSFQYPCWHRVVHISLFICLSVFFFSWLRDFAHRECRTHDDSSAFSSD